MENPPQVYRQECVSCDVKQSQKGILLGKMLLQFPAASSPDQVGSLILIPILLEETSKSFLQQVSSKFSDQD